MRSKLASLLFCSALLVTPAAASAGSCNASVAAKTVDVALARPLSLVTASVTSGIWVGLSPLLGLIGVARQAGEVLVVDPWRYTGGRHIGCFDRYIR